MAILNLNKTLWRIPQQGIIKGVCAGLAQYFGVPVKLIRVLVVLSVFFGLGFFTLVAYIILTLILKPMPEHLVQGQQILTSRERLNAVDRVLANNERRLREMERYVTSGTFTLHNRFRQL